MALGRNSPTGMGGRGTLPNTRSFSGANQDGICLRRASKGRSSSPALGAVVANPSRPSSGIGALDREASAWHWPRQGAVGSPAARSRRLQASGCDALAPSAAAWAASAPLQLPAWLGSRCPCGFRRPCGLRRPCGFGLLAHERRQQSVVVARHAHGGTRSARPARSRAAERRLLPDETQEIGAGRACEPAPATSTNFTRTWTGMPNLPDTIPSNFKRLTYFRTFV